MAIKNPPAGTACVDITITTFLDIFNAVPIGTGRAVVHTMVMRAKHDRVSVPAIGRLAVKADAKKPPYKPVDILFTIVTPGYFPVGVALKEVFGVANPTPESAVGFVNFKQKNHHPDGNSFSITDDFDDLDANDLYELYIFVQNAQGDIGIIDPIIIHEPN